MLIDIAQPAELMRSTKGVAFDEMPMSELSMNDLDLKSIQATFSDQRKVNEKSLQSLKLLRKEQGRLVPTKGAILLFGKERTEVFPDAWVQCGRFSGIDKAVIFDHIDIDEPMPQALESIMLFLKRHARRGADFSELRRKDVWSIPLVILREAVINALVHSDYSQRGAPIRISFFDDRIEIENPGILLPGLTIEDMKQGISKIRNPVIIRVFRELNLVEQWGSGVKRIFREAQEQGLPEVQILEIGMRLRLVIRFAEYHSTLGSFPENKSAAESTIQSRAQSRAQSEAQSRAQSPAPPEVQSEAVLQLLLNAPLSAAELVVRLNLGSKNGAFKRSILDLLARQLIAYVSPDKPSSRLQKYCITAQGQQLLAR